jgi:hypothetical protein
VKPPETFIHSIYLHMRGAIAALVMGHYSFEGDQGTRGFELMGEARVRGNFFSQSLSKEASGRDDVSCSAQAVEEKISETCAYRITYEQRAREHGDGRADAEYDRQIGAPIMCKVAFD